MPNISLVYGILRPRSLKKKDSLVVAPFLGIILIWAMEKLSINESSSKDSLQHS
jgi:hypothetical protein